MSQSMRMPRAVLALVAVLCLSVTVHVSRCARSRNRGRLERRRRAPATPAASARHHRRPAHRRRGPGPPTEGMPVRLVALLTSDGQHIDQGLIWRVFGTEGHGEGGKTTLINTYREASPILKAKPGDYFVNVAFGRAHLTRRITVKPGTGEASRWSSSSSTRGGLRVTALVSGHEAPANSVSYSVYSDRDQSDNRKVVLSAPSPASSSGSTPASITSFRPTATSTPRSRAMSRVEAGKLTEVSLTHSAAKATFKLVHRAGGEALPDTEWSIQTPQGDEIKHSAGALPTHILAPGTYTVIAKSQGKTFEREFSLTDGDTSQVEVADQVAPPMRLSTMIASRPYQSEA